MEKDYSKIVEEILEILKNNEITYRELYMLLEKISDKFRSLAVIKKD